MITKAAAASVPPQESDWSEAVASCLVEMEIIRKRMKATDRRIQRANAPIRRNQEETRTILRNVEAGL